MADAYGGGDRMWGVTVDLPSLALDVAVLGRELVSWAREVRREVRARSAATKDEALRTRLALVEHHVPDEADFERIEKLVARVEIL